MSAISEKQIAKVYPFSLTLRFWHFRSSLALWSERVSAIWHWLIGQELFQGFASPLTWERRKDYKHGVTGVPPVQLSEAHTGTCLLRTSKSCHHLGSDFRTGLTSTASGGKHQLSPARVSSWTEENIPHKQPTSANSSSLTSARCQLRERSSWCHLQHQHLPERTWRQQPAWSLWDGVQSWQGEFEEHVGSSVPKTEVTVDPPGWHCQKSLDHRLNEVRGQQKCQVLKSQRLQAIVSQTYRQRGKKLLHLCCC